MSKSSLRMFTGFAALTLLITQMVQAQSVPAKIVGTGAFNSSDLSFGGEAIGSHLGTCNFEGKASLYPDPADPTGFVLLYYAPDVYTAANGDTLELLGIGSVTLTLVDVREDGEPVFTALWNGTWTVTGGSGRFANATGAYELTAVNEPFAFSDEFWYFRYEKKGTIDLGRQGQE